MVSGLFIFQHEATGKPCGVGIVVSDGARVEHGVCGFHRNFGVRSDGMRGNRMGFRDFDAVQGWSWGPRDTAGGDDGRGAGREQDGHILSGPWLFE